jgi:hypothetical protein
MSKPTINLNDLAKPFPANDIEWRIGRCGTKQDGSVWAVALAYLTSRAIHDRLDEVCGSENWQLRYKEHLGETVAEIGIRIKNEWIWKAGGGNKTDFEAFKGGLSSAEKRAGVPWGIGRYLYNLTETFVETNLKKQTGPEWKYQAPKKNKNTGEIIVPAFYWKAPQLPDWALPKKSELMTLGQIELFKNFIKGIIPEAVDEHFVKAASFLNINTKKTTKDEFNLLWGTKTKFDDLKKILEDFSDASI